MKLTSWKKFVKKNFVKIMIIWTYWWIPRFNSFLSFYFLFISTCPCDYFKQKLIRKSYRKLSLIILFT